MALEFLEDGCAIDLIMKRSMRIEHE